MGIRAALNRYRLRRAARVYFTDAELEHATFAGRGLDLFDARFELGADGLVLAEAPDDEWLRGQIAALTPGQAVWEVAAFLKVRRLARPDEVVARARSGELYDESYFTRRGGGAPYIGYPLEINGFAGDYATLAASVLRRHPARRVLDIGCATGGLVRAFTDAGVEAHGVDFAAWAVEHRVIETVVLGSALALPWPDATFDLVTSSDFMEHMHPDDLPGVIAEQVRVLAPEGRILHLVPFYDSDPPVQVDAHLCQATKDWWLRFLRAQPRIEVVHESVLYAPDLVDRYVELRVTGG